MKKIKIVILSLLALSLISCAGAAGGGGGGGSGATITPVNLDVGASNFYIIMQNPTGAIKNTPQAISGNSVRSAIVDNYIREMKIQGNPISIPVEQRNFNFNINASLNRSATTTTSFLTYSWDHSDEFMNQLNNYPATPIYHNFYAEESDYTPNDQYASNAELKAVGQHCYVWYKAKDGIDLSGFNFQNLADKFDSIYDIETHIFGSNIPNPQNIYYAYSLSLFYPVDTKVHILVYDIYDDYTPNFSYNTDGYFTAIDMVQDDLVSPNSSNNCQCIHIDSGRLSINPNYTYSTLAHEFQHLIHFVNKTVNTAGTAYAGGQYHFSDTWFNEMLSMVCEDIMMDDDVLNLQPSDGPQSRLKLFNQTYNYGFKNWLDDDESLISYANAYTFGAFLLRNYGIECIKEITQSTLINEDAVLNAVQNIDSSITTFDKLLRQFADVIIYPTSTASNVHNLNKSVSYNIPGTSPAVILTCGAINLNSYCTYSASYIIDDETTSSNGIPASYFKGAVAGQAYYGPVILNGWWLDQIGPYGTCVLHIQDTQSVNSITLQDQSNNTMKYYVIADN